MKPKYRMVPRPQTSVLTTTANSSSTTIHAVAYVLAPVGWLRWKLWLRACPLWSEP